MDTAKIWLNRSSKLHFLSVGRAQIAGQYRLLTPTAFIISIIFSLSTYLIPDSCTVDSSSIFRLLVSLGEDMKDWERRFIWHVWKTSLDSAGILVVLWASRLWFSTSSLVPMVFVKVFAFSSSVSAAVDACCHAVLFILLEFTRTWTKLSLLTSGQHLQWFSGVVEHHQLRSDAGPQNCRLP